MPKKKKLVLVARSSEQFAFSLPLHHACSFFVPIISYGPLFRSLPLSPTNSVAGGADALPAAIILAAPRGMDGKVASFDEVDSSPAV